MNGLNLNKIIVLILVFPLALISNEKDFSTKINLQVGSIYTAGSSDFFENYLEYINPESELEVFDPSMVYQIGISYGLNPKLNLKLNLSSYSIRFVDQFTIQISQLYPSVDIVNSFKQENISSDLLIEYRSHPFHQFRSFIGGGLKIARNRTSWSERIENPSPALLRSGGGIYVENDFQFGLLFVSGIELDFDSYYVKNLVKGIIMDFSFHYLNTSENYFESYNEKYGINSDDLGKNISINNLYLSFNIGLNLELYHTK